MIPPFDARFVSMTRLGAEFGWSVRQTARVLNQCGYRSKGRPTPLALQWVRTHTNPAGEDAYRWDLAGMVQQLVSHGHTPDDPVRVASRLLWEVCGKFNAHQHKYFEGAKRKQVAREALDAQLAPLLDRVHAMPSLHAAAVFRCLEENFNRTEDKGHWTLPSREDAWRWMGISKADRQAHALALDTQAVGQSRSRSRL